MRILGLLNSNVEGGDANIPQEELFPARMATSLSKKLGEDIEIVPRNVWPTPRLPERVAAWVRDVQPELVVYPVTSFWFLYESTPVRMERKLGKPGKLLGKAFREAAALPWLAHNPVFQWSRKQTQKAIGGQSWFSADEVAEVSCQVISAVLRAESSYLVVLAPGSGDRWARDERHRQALEARRQLVDRRVGDFCRAHHVEYWTRADLEALKDPRGSSLQGDQLHLDKEGHRRVAERYAEWSMGLIQRALSATREGVIPGTPT